MVNRNRRDKFVFRKHATIGAADAIEDKYFLQESFVDKGELDILCDQLRPECVVLGRTGTGKTALLEKLDAIEERVIKIAPESLALSYISNNNVLNFFRAVGVDLDLFYRLLWRHVFAIEIIKERFDIINERSRDNFLVRIKEKVFGNKSKQEAIDYLFEWGESFWEETDYRVKEITKKLENDLTGSLAASVEGKLPSVTKTAVSLNAGLARTLTQEEKAEIVNRGQPVVNKVQIRVLSEIIKLLESDILDDRQKNYYITIDRLDENWVNDDLRYFLIRALLETVRDFNTKLTNVKIIVALREDLLDRVFRYTRSPGYQEEKYKSNYLTLMWKEDELEDLLDKRVHQLVKEQYTQSRVRLRQLLPAKVKNDAAVKYLLDRTLMRPRDAIMYFNECISLAANRAKITEQMILQAEAPYSESRLRAVGDEWSADYPNLVELALFLKRFPCSFRSKSVKHEVANRMLDFLIVMEDEWQKKRDVIFRMVEEKFNSGDFEDFLHSMFKILYRVGVVGVQDGQSDRVKWSYMGHKLLSSEPTPETVIQIHPAFWSVLEVSDV